MSSSAERAWGSRAFCQTLKRQRKEVSRAMKDAKVYLVPSLSFTCQGQAAGDESTSPKDGYGRINPQEWLADTNIRTRIALGMTSAVFSFVRDAISWQLMLRTVSQPKMFE